MFFILIQFRVKPINRITFYPFEINCTTFYSNAGHKTSHHLILVYDASKLTTVCSEMPFNGHLKIKDLLHLFSSLRIVLFFQNSYKERWNSFVIFAVCLGSLSCWKTQCSGSFAIMDHQSLFVAFCSFFPCSLTVFIQGRQQKSGGRQQKSSRADKQHCFP